MCLNDIPELFNNLSRPPRWLARLHASSALVRLVVNAEGREIDSVERLFAEPEAPRVREAMDRFFEEVRALRREVEADGASFAMVVFPFRFQVEEGAPRPVVQERVASFCASEGLRCLDLLPTLASARAGRVRRLRPPEPGRGVARGRHPLRERTPAAGGLGGGRAPPGARGPGGGRGRAGRGARGARVAGRARGVRDRARRHGPEEARGQRAALFAALADPSEPVRAASARALARVEPQADDVPRLVAALGSEDGYVAAFAAWSLGNLGSAAAGAVPDLVRALARDDTNAVVAGALARIGPAAAAAVPTLVEALRSEDADRRWRAARTLGRIGPSAEAAVGALAKALADPNGAVRQHAARALGRIGPAARPAAAALQRATGDTDPQVRDAARQALGTIHREEAAR